MKLDSEDKFVAKVIGVIIFIVFSIFMLVVYRPFKIIEAGEIGVQTLFGSTYPNLLNPGFNLINPLSSVHSINLRTQTTNADSEAASSDLQIVHTNITLNYRVDLKNAINLFVNFGSDEETLQNSIVQPYVKESFKAVVAKFTAENLINKREEVSREIEEILSKKLNKSYLDVVSISVTGFQFSASFNEAIEKKVTAQQEVLTAKNNYEKQRIDNDIKVSKAKAEAESLNLQKMAVTEELIRLRQVENETKAIEKWDGVLPLYTSTVPFIKEIK